ncbi:MAG: hypothetical protein Q4A32_03565 [Lachnospiraceae bacterium]|nr:hypothetical protein [Lachnospiraceae bacterium]
MNRCKNLAKKHRMNIQLFTVPENETKTGDLAPAISIDFTNRIKQNIETLQRILGVVELIPMNAGTLIKIYKETVTIAEQVAEGEVIGLSKVERKLAKTIEIGLGKYRKQVTAESIQQHNQDRAINLTDEKLIGEVRKQVKRDFFGTIAAGTGVAQAGTDLQSTMAFVWAALQKKFVDMDVTPIYFVSSDDVADYLAKGTITLQTAFGFTYVENFLGLGTAFVHPELEKGEVIGTVLENLNGAYVPSTGGDLAQAFNLTGDESGLVGMTHSIETDNASITTLLFCSVVFFPELLDGVIKGKIGAEGEEEEEETPAVTYTAVEEPTGSPAGQGWYELVNEEYVLSEDTEVDSGKTYYVASA